MTAPVDLLVLGGGIAGLTVALAASARGLRVTVIDEWRRGGASRASAGMLAPSIGSVSSEVLAIAVAARDLYPPFLAGLLESTGVAVPLDRRGILELADSEEGLVRLAARAPATSFVVDARALAGQEPSLGHHPGAVWHPSDGAVDNVRLMAALDAAVTRHPGIVRIVGAVVAVGVHATRTTLQTADGVRHAGGRVVVAAGAWTGILPGLPRTVPVRPVRGQLMRLRAVPLHHVTHADHGYLIPRGDSLLVGATSEETGFESATSAEGLATLRAVAASTIPSLGDCQVADHWAGLRPVTPDGLPVLGPDPDHPSLLYACGYSRNGILYAPWAAGQLARLLSDGDTPTDLAPFRVGRFALPVE